MKVLAFYGILGDKKTAVIEMAAASGLTLVPENKRDPLITTTYGTGQLIKAALEPGVSKDDHWHWRKCHQRWRGWNASGFRG